MRIFLYISSRRSYSNTRSVAPSTGRSHRSPATVLKTSDTMRSHETNVSSVDSTRRQSRPTGLALTTMTTGTTDTTPNDAYQQVYHDDSSTHGSRTLDSRFSRDKYDLSDDESTDDEAKDKQEKEQDQNEPSPSTTTAPKPINGSSSSSPGVRAIIDLSHDQNDFAKEQTELEPAIDSKCVIEPNELEKSKSPGSFQRLSKDVYDDEEEEEDHSESNHKKANRVSLEIYHNDKKETEDQISAHIEVGKRYSASLKMYLNARHSSGGSHSICLPSQYYDVMDENDEEEQQKLLLKRFQQQQRSHSLQLERTLSLDLTHSPSGSSSSSDLEPPNLERLIGSKPNDDQTIPSFTDRSPAMVIEIRSKSHALPRMDDYIEYIDRRTLPSINSLSWQDDTITTDHMISLSKEESSEDPIELVREVIEFILTQIVDEERQFYKIVDRLVEQACSRALSLYLMERRAQLFSGSSDLPHHKSCTLRKKLDSDNHQDGTSIVTRLRTKSSPAITTTTTDWTDVSRKLAAQTCFAAYPSGSNIHELNRSEFSTFSEAKLKFFNIISTDVVPSHSSVSLPIHLPLSTTHPNVLSSSSSTRSSRASSVSSYASSMHVPCPPLLDSHSRRHQRPLSARLLDFSDDSDSNPTTSISTSLKTCILPTTVSNVQSIPPPPPLRTQRRLQQQQQQQQKRRSSEDVNSSSDDSLSNHLNKAAGFRSVFVQRNYPHK